MLGHQFPEQESLWQGTSNSSSPWLPVAAPGLESAQDDTECPSGSVQDPVQQDHAHKQSVPAAEDKEVNRKWVLPTAKPKAKAAVPGQQPVTLKVQAEAMPKSSLSISPKAIPKSLAGSGRPKSPPMKRKADEVQAPTTSTTEAEAEAPKMQRLNSQTGEATSPGTCKSKVQQSPARQWVIEERFKWLADWETTFQDRDVSEINKNRFCHVLNLVNPSEQRDYLLDHFLKTNIFL